MRRKDREITDIKEILAILEACKVMRIAMCRENRPYVVPLSFGYSYENGGFTLYFHCAKEGKKLDWLRENPCLAFEMDCGHNMLPAQSPCSYGYECQSILGEGTAFFVEDPEEKKEILHRYMKHQTGRDFSFTDAQAETVGICKILVEHISAKSMR